MTDQTTWGSTLWHATARNVRPRAILSGDHTADLAIVGGGFTGLSSALHAAERGQAVALIEAETLAWGATGRNAGFVVPNFAKMDPDDVIARLGADRGERLVGFAGASADLVFSLIARHAIDCDAQRSGWIQPAHSAAALARIASRAKQWAARGRPAVVLDRGEIAALTGAAGYHGGWIDRSGGVLNPVAYAHGLAGAAEAFGARLWQNSRAIRIERAGNEWRVTTQAGTLRAPKLLLATNAHGGALSPNLARCYFPLTVHQVATHPLPAELRRRIVPGGQCVSDSRRNLFTFRLDAAGRLISGGMDIIPLGAGRRVPRTIHRRLARLLGVPDLPPLAYAWAGTAAVMPDFLPRLIELGPGLLAGIACNGRGIALTTMLGRVLSDWATGTPIDELPVPSGPPMPIPYHAAARYAPNVLLPYGMLRDAM